MVDRHIVSALARFQFLIGLSSKKIEIFPDTVLGGTWSLHSFLMKCYSVAALNFVGFMYLDGWMTFCFLTTLVAMVTCCSQSTVESA